MRDTTTDAQLRQAIARLNRARSPEEQIAVITALLAQQTIDLADATHGVIVDNQFSAAAVSSFQGSTHDYAVELTAKATRRFRPARPELAQRLARRTSALYWRRLFLLATDPTVGVFRVPT